LLTTYYLHQLDKLKQSVVSFHQFTLPLVAISHNSEKRKRAGITPPAKPPLSACNYNVMNVRYLEESPGVTAIQWIPRLPLSVPFGRLLPFPLLPSHSGSVHGTFLASRGACSCRGRQFANSTHSDMIDNRKPLRGPDDFFF